MKRLFLLLSTLSVLGFASQTRAQEKPTPAAEIESLKQHVAVLREQLNEAGESSELPQYSDELVIEVPASGPMILNDEDLTSDQIAGVLARAEIKTAACILLANPDATCRRLGEAIDLVNKSKLGPASIFVGADYVSILPASHLLSSKGSSKGNPAPSPGVELLKHQIAVLRQRLEGVRKSNGTSEYYDELVIKVPASGPITLNDEELTSDQIEGVLARVDLKTAVCVILASPDASCKRLSEAIDLVNKSKLAPASIIVGTNYVSKNPPPKPAGGKHPGLIVPSPPPLTPLK